MPLAFPQILSLAARSVADAAGIWMIGYALLGEPIAIRRLIPASLALGVVFFAIRYLPFGPNVNAFFLTASPVPVLIITLRERPFRAVFISAFGVCFLVLSVVFYVTLFSRLLGLFPVPVGGDFVFGDVPHALPVAFFVPGVGILLQRSVGRWSGPPISIDATGFSPFSPATNVVGMVHLAQGFFFCILFFYAVSIFNSGRSTGSPAAFVVSCFSALVVAAAILGRNGPRRHGGFAFACEAFDFVVVFPLLVWTLWHVRLEVIYYFLLVPFVLINSIKERAYYGLASVVGSAVTILALRFHPVTTDIGARGFEEVLLKILTLGVVFVFVRFVFWSAANESFACRTIAALGDPCLYTDRDGRIVTVNEPMLRFIGLPKAEVVGHDVGKFLTDRRTGESIDTVGCDNGNGGCGPFSVNGILTAADGCQLDFHCTRSPLMDELNNTVGVIITARPRTKDLRWELVKTTFGLSTREMEILRLVLLGCSNQDIAERAFISVNTVKSHLYSAFRKLKVSNRAQAIVLLDRHSNGVEGCIDAPAGNS